jgi:hypothetical protein
MGDIAALTRMRADISPWGGGSWDDFVGWLSASGFPLLNQTWTSNEEKIEGDFAGLVHGVYQGNSVVFACLQKRFMLFSQARFQFQQMRGGQPGDLFGTPDLRIIENPEPGETTADLLTLARLDADLAGDWFGVRRPGRIKRLRPDFTTILVGSPNRDTTYPAADPDAEVAGFSFSTNGRYGPGETWSFERGEVAHFAPIRDPLVKYRGMPLPTAALREIRADSAATTHKLKFFEHAATPNMVVKFPPAMTKPKAEEAIELFEQEHAGAFNAYRTVYLLGGAEATVVGKDLQQLDFAATQGKGETRIVAAMGLHPSIVPVSEGLQGSALNEGNFGAARRLVADTFLRPDWGSFAGSLETILPPLPGSRLWYDDRHIPFLAEDVKDAVAAFFVQAQAARQLGDGGWDHDAVIDAVSALDIRRLAGQHTGLVPVQLQTPGAGSAPAFAARRDFWPVTGDWTSAQVARGDHFAPNHPLVAAFPSLFEPVAELNGHAVQQWSAPIRVSSILTLPALAAPSPNGGQ